MATWKEVSLDSLAAAKELLASGRWRSSVSRAYYAVYARTTAELEGVATFAADREGPGHQDLPDLLYDYLTRLLMRDRWLFSAVVGRMYEKRIDADYRPSRTVDQAVARDAVTWADRFIKVVEAAYG